MLPCRVALIFLILPLFSYIATVKSDGSNEDDNQDEDEPEEEEADNFLNATNWSPEGAILAQKITEIEVMMRRGLDFLNEKVSAVQELVELNTESMAALATVTSK